MKFLKDNFLNLIVIVLVVILFLQRCGDKNPIGDSPIIKRDTTWIHKDSIVFVKPQLIKTIPIDVHHDSIIREYLPDTSYDELLKQYQAVVFELLNRNIFQDSLKIDSIGYVKVIDTVSKNLIAGRSYNYNLKYPIIKETITLPEKKKNQVYVGGGIEGNQITPLSRVSSGVLLKTKKDHILSATLSTDKDLNLLYGIHSYWKIKL